VTREKELPVTFRPGGRTVFVLPGTRLTEAAALAGMPLEQPCGGSGKCGKCVVRVLHNAAPPTPAETKLLAADQLERGMRLGCQTTVQQPISVEVPETSRLAAQRILTRAAAGRARAADPAVRKQYVELSAPRRGDDAPDLIRLEQTLGEFRIGLEMLRLLPGRMRETEFRGTAVLAGDEMIDFEAADTRAQTYGVAVDLGTTTTPRLVLATMCFRASPMPRKSPMDWPGCRRRSSTRSTSCWPLWPGRQTFRWITSTR